MTRRAVVTDTAPAAIGPYSQGLVVGNILFTAGQLGIDPAGGGFVASDAAGQARRALRNLRGVVEAAGFAMDEVVKVTVFLADMDDFAAVNAVYREFFGDEPPARSAVQVARLPLDGRVEIEAVAVRG